MLAQRGPPPPMGQQGSGGGPPPHMGSGGGPPPMGHQGSGGGPPHMSHQGSGDGPPPPSSAPHQSSEVGTPPPGPPTPVKTHLPQGNLRTHLPTCGSPSKPKNFEVSYLVMPSRKRHTLSTFSASFENYRQSFKGHLALYLHLKLFYLNIKNILGTALSDFFPYDNILKAGSALMDIIVLF